MAYSNFTNTYNGYMGANNYYSNPYQTNWMQQQQMQPQNQYDAPLQGVIFLTSDEAKAYIVPPNKRMLIMDRDKSVFYIKSADALGQSSTSAYRFEPLEQDKPIVEVEDSSIKDDYVTKSDIKGFVTSEDLENLKDDFNKSLEDFKKSFMKKVLNESGK